MNFNLIIPGTSGNSLNVSVSVGQTLFIFGANGTGKSNLMQRFYSSNSGNARRISAHRQTWFESGATNLSSEQRRSREHDIRNYDTQSHSRWRDTYANYRPNISIYDLIQAENIRARSIAGAVDATDMQLAETLSKTDAPLKIINRLLRLSNLRIQISIGQNDQVVASKCGGAPYSIAELSDGERNALLLAADVLTVEPGTLVLIDEPERHLHRSIISPMLTRLFEYRRDCVFVLSTHEVMLTADNPSARTLLLRECIYSGTDVLAWEADLVEPDAQIPEDVRRDILGGRRKLLFIEGDEHSLDKSLYSLIFPHVSIIPKSGCREVENAVVGIRSATDLHWLQAFGIVDNDGRTQFDINALKTKGIYALSVYSVESIYYNPEVQRRVAERHATVTGEDASTRLANAKSAAISAVTSQVQRLSERAVEKALREKILSQLPGQPEIAAGIPINFSIDVGALVASERVRLEANIRNDNLSDIIGRYPVRETSALTDIARKLGFQNRDQYEGTVRKLLMDDQETVGIVRSFFGSLPSDIGTP
jgi:ABC-type cobalamin/Fe3+-siderophores transport system ATPase subunit